MLGAGPQLGDPVGIYEPGRRRLTVLDCTAPSTTVLYGTKQTQPSSISILTLGDSIAMRLLLLLSLSLSLSLPSQADRQVGRQAGRQAV